MSDDINIDWSEYPNVERIPGKVFGQWIVKDTRMLADRVIENWAEGLSAEEIAEEVYSGLGVELARRIIEHAKANATIRILLDQNAPLGLRRVSAARLHLRRRAGLGEA